MNGISLRSVVLTGALLTFVSSAAWADTITPSFFLYTPGVSIVYTATLNNGTIQAGIPGQQTGFTIFDIGGFTTAVAPPNWTVSSTPTTSPFDPTPVANDPVLMNVHFTYSGTISITDPPMPPPTPLGSFIVNTTWTGPLTTDDWVSRDRNPSGNLRDPLEGSTSVPTFVPSVPDGGATMSLLGLAMLSVGLLRRHLL